MVENSVLLINQVVWIILGNMLTNNSLNKFREENSLLQRNPTNDPRGPWCYKLDEHEVLETEYCDIPECEGNCFSIPGGSH